MFLPFGILSKRVFECGLMYHQRDLLAVVQDILAWIGITRIEYSSEAIPYSTLVLRDNQASVRLSAVIDLDGTYLLNTH